MNEKLKKAGEKVKSVWGGLTKRLRILIISVAAVLLVGTIALTVLLNGSNGWLVLFPGMSQEEATQVYLELQNMSVETRINSKGEIEVREDQWDKLVYQLADLGYPQSAPSYGTFFDNLSMTMTEFEKEQTLRFELQDRLEATLKRLDNIRGAVVTISVPESSNYVWEQSEDKATASVTLTLDNSAKFTADNVSAVKNLVAYSAQKMEPKDVKVVDAGTGQTLLSVEEVKENSLDDSGAEEQLNYSNIVKNQYEVNAERILSPIFGNVTAVAAVTLNYDKITEEVKKMINDEALKQHETVEFKTPEEVGDGGIVGEENNTDIPGYKNEQDYLTSNNGNYYYRDTEWAVGYVLTQTEKARGIVTNASIAVVVATDGGRLSNEERDNAVALVKNATNIPAEQISVSSRASMDESIQAQAEPAFAGFDWKKILMIAVPIAAFILILMILLIVGIVRRNRKKLKKQMEAQQAESNETIATLQQTIEDTQRQTLEEAAKLHGEQDKATANEVREFAKKNPEITAALIRSLMKEDE